MKCTSCRNEHSREAAFCPHCGAAVVSGTLNQSGRGAPFQAPVVPCVCGRQLSSQDIFCPGCGRAAAQPGAPAGSYSNQPYGSPSYSSPSYDNPSSGSPSWGSPSTGSMGSDSPTGSYSPGGRSSGYSSGGYPSIGPNNYPPGGYPPAGNYSSGNYSAGSYPSGNYPSGNYPSPGAAPYYGYTGPYLPVPVPGQSLYLYRRKDKVAAGLFALLLGAFGAHKFYLGNVGMGCLYLLFCWTGIPGIAGLVEGIIYLCQSDREFDYHYNYRP